MRARRNLIAPLLVIAIVAMAWIGLGMIVTNSYYQLMLTLVPIWAVKAEPDAGGGGVSNWRNNKKQPFTSDLSGQDFWTLIRAGYAPLGMVMGSCVYHIAHQRMGAKIGNIGRNVEIEQFTQALYDARELAMSRMQAEAEALHAEGIVGVQLRQHSHTWGSHTTEFFAIGTAVRPLRDNHIIERPTMVLSLDS